MTGCILVDDAHNKACVGDLFKIGTAWIFAGNTWPNGGLMWQEADGIPEACKQLIVKDCPGICWLERGRVVAIAPGPWVRFNKAGQEYLA